MNGDLAMPTRIVIEIKDEATAKEVDDFFADLHTIYADYDIIKEIRIEREPERGE